MKRYVTQNPFNRIKDSQATSSHILFAAQDLRELLIEEENPYCATNLASAVAGYAASNFMFDGNYMDDNMTTEQYDDWVSKAVLPISYP